MQALAQKTVRSGAAGVATRSARGSRTVVARAALDSRREVLAGFLAGVASLGAAQQAVAATPVDLKDDRNVRAKGFDIIYEARDLDLPQNVRDGLTQARESLEDTKKRVKASESRIDTEVDSLVAKAYWTKAREELRGQVGTLRFDLNILAETKGKDGKKKALELKKVFLSEVDKLDGAIRAKDPAAATKAMASTKSSLDAVLAAVL